MDVIQRGDDANQRVGDDLYGLVGPPFMANLLLDGTFYGAYIIWPGLAPLLVGMAIIIIPLVNFLVVSWWSLPHGCLLEKLFWTLASVTVIQMFSAYVALPTVGWLLKVPPFFR